MEDACSETPGCRREVVSGGHFNDQGPGTPIGASGISMKSLKEDKNDGVVNAALKPE